MISWHTDDKLSLPHCHTLSHSLAHSHPIVGLLPSFLPSFLPTVWADKKKLSCALYPMPVCCVASRTLTLTLSYD